MNDWMAEWPNYPLVNIWIKYLLLISTISSILTPDVCAIEVDIYQSCNNGNNGDLLTAEIMNASSYGGIVGLPDAEWKLDCPDQDTNDGLWVSEEVVTKLPGQVIVNGKDCSVKSRCSWRWRNKYEHNRVAVMFGNERKYTFKPYHDRITIACYFTTFQTDRSDHDNIVIGGPDGSGANWGAYGVFHVYARSSE